VARRNGEAYISPLDLRTAVHPLLYPARNDPKQKLKTICIDPGHGGKDPGNQEGKNQEKKYALLLAEELRKLLKDAGYKVVLTRSGDQYVDLPSRPDLAKRSKADLLVSLHFNSAPDASVRGVETYAMTPAFASSTNARGEGASTGSYPGNRSDDKNLLLAWNVHKALTRALGTTDRGVRRARFAVLRFAEMPAVLIESGYMSHAEEGKKIMDAAWRTKVAKAITDGIQAYKKTVER
jgi:N-acetylmuramoyl-L-alanine amidase